MNLTSCFLFGHHDASESCIPLLQNELAHHIRHLNVTQFLVGHYGNFDTYAIHVLQKLKEQYPHISLLLLTPYHPAIRSVPLPDGFDNTYYPADLEKVPPRYAIIRANQHAVQNCDYIICLVSHYGNTRSLLNYASKQAHAVITNLHEKFT